MDKPSRTKEYPARPEPPASVDAVQLNVAAVRAEVTPAVWVGEDAAGAVGGVVSGGGIRTNVAVIEWTAVTFENV